MVFLMVIYGFSFDKGGSVNVFIRGFIFNREE